MTDSEILQLIRKGSLEKPIKELYKSLPVFRLTLLKYKATENQIQEIFNDSLVLLIEKTNEADFHLNSKLTTFLIGIALNKLRNIQRKENRSSQFIQFSSDIPDTNLSFEFDDEKEEKLTIIDSILDTIQDRCKQILRLFYYEKKSMQEISALMNFSSMQSAKTQKYKCLEKAHQMANELIVESKKTVL